MKREASYFALLKARSESGESTSCPIKKGAKIDGQKTIWGSERRK